MEYTITECTEHIQWGRYIFTLPFSLGHEWESTA